MNKDLISNFQALADYNSKIGETFRARAYKNVIIILKNFPNEITSLLQVKGISGIGKKSLAKIQEYIDTGQIRAAKEAKEELSKYMDKPKTSQEEILDLFKTVWGIGEAKALELYNSGMRTLSDLRKNKHLLTENQKIGLHYYKDLIRPVKREYIDILRLGIMVILTKTFGKDSFDIEICGSYRRKALFSGDMDILLTSTKFTLKDVVRVLTEWEVIVEVLAMRDEKGMFIGHCPAGGQFIRIDIQFVEANQWGSSLLYFTGSKSFNQYTRSISKRKGYRLNQHGLFNADTGKRIPVYTEKEILQHIGINYIDPEYR